MNSKAKFRSSRYDSMKLFYYRTRLRVSDAYDSVKSSLLPSLPINSCSETDLSSDSEKYYSKMKLRNKIRISEPGKMKLKCHLLQDTNRRNCIAKGNVISLRKRRSSRTRSRYCTDSDLSGEHRFGNSNPGTGDQRDSSSGKETDYTEKRLIQEPKSNSQISTRIKNVSEEECGQDAKNLQMRDALEPESNQTPVAIPVLKAKRKSSTPRKLKATKTKTASLPIKDETELMMKEATGSENAVKYQNIFTKSLKVAFRENKTFQSIKSRFPSRQKILAEAKQKNLTVGWKVVNNSNSVRKQTCTQKLKNVVFGLANKASNPLKDVQENKNGANDEKETPKSDFAPNVPLFMDNYLYALFANGIPTTNHSEPVSHSPYYKYFLDNPSLIDSKNISNQENVNQQCPTVISSNTPNVPLLMDNYSYDLFDNRIPTTNHSEPVSQSPYYKYLSHNPGLIDSKNISNQENVNQQFPSAISSYTPNTPFTKQFEYLFEKT